VQLVLHRLEERLGRLGLLVVVDAALLVDVGDLQVEAPLAGADLPDPLEQLVEVVLAEALVQLEPLVVEDEALDDELAQRLGRPDAELGGLRAVDAVADGDDRVEVVELDLAPDLPISLAELLEFFGELPPGSARRRRKSLSGGSLRCGTSTPNSSAMRRWSSQNVSDS
jgi:hypothetical protein